MAGHSKWANIKRKKQAMDAKRGKLFTKLAREIQVAAREGGPDPDSNLRLRLVLEKARAANMPKENIERAIRRGAGLEAGGAALEEITYEAYAPHGIALMIQVMTDNRKRAVAEIRHVLTKHGGSMGESGSVAWQFEQKGYIVVPTQGRDEDELFMAALEAGADDVEITDDMMEVYTTREDFAQVQQALKNMGLQPEDAELAWVPKNRVTLGPEEAVKVMKVIELLEDLDDVNKVYSNLEIPEEALQALEAA